MHPCVQSSIIHALGIIEIRRKEMLPGQSTQTPFGGPCWSSNRGHKYCDVVVSLTDTTDICVMVNSIQPAGSGEIVLPLPTCLFRALALIRPELTPAFSLSTKAFDCIGVNSPASFPCGVVVECKLSHGRDIPEGEESKIIESIITMVP